MRASVAAYTMKAHLLCVRLACWRGVASIHLPASQRIDTLLLGAIEGAPAEAFAGFLNIGGGGVDRVQALVP